jgi:hypothetical protein
VQGRGRTVQAGRDLGRAGRDRQERLGDGGQIGRQRADAHHGAARSGRPLAAMMLRRGPILRGGVVMRMGRCVVRRGVAMHVGVRLVVHRHGISELGLVRKTRCRTAAPGEGCRRRDHAEQIGEGNEAPHPDPHRSCQSPQHRLPCSPRGNVAHARLQTNGKARFRQALLTAVHRACPISQRDA